MIRMDRIGKERFTSAAAGRGQTRNPKCKIRNKAKKRRKQEENLNGISRNHRIVMREQTGKRELVSQRYVAAAGQARRGS